MYWQASSSSRYLRIYRKRYPSFWLPSTNSAYFPSSKKVSSLTGVVSLSHFMNIYRPYWIAAPAVKRISFFKFFTSLYYCDKRFKMSFFLIEKVSGFWMEGERWDCHREHSNDIECSPRNDRVIKTNHIYLQIGKMCKVCGKISSWKPYIVKLFTNI